MSARDDVPAEIRRMKTSELVIEVVSLSTAILDFREARRQRYVKGDYVLTLQLADAEDRRAVVAAELDRRIPPSEGA